MKLNVNTSSDTPLYLQIYNQISGAILSGELKSGEALPPIRTVAAELRISLISVRRAWEELDRDGFISSEVGRGSFVRNFTDEERTRLCKEQLRSALLPALNRCRELGLSKDSLMSVLEDL